MTKLCDLLPEIPEPRYRYGLRLLWCEHCNHGTFHALYLDDQAGMYKTTCDMCGMDVWISAEEATCGPPMMGDFL